MTRTIYKTAEGQKSIKDFYNENLALFPMIKESYIKTSFGQTFIVQLGDRKNPPLLLIHGSGSNSLSWMGECKNLSATHSVYCIDIPGEPGNSSTERFSTIGDSFTLWLDEVIKELHIIKPILGGLSLGGWAAIRYAMDRPESVQSVIALAPTGIVKPKSGYLLKMIYYSMRGEKGIRKLMSIMFDGGPVPEAVVQFQLLLTEHFNYRMDVPTLFADGELSNMSVPFTYVCGREDFIFDGAKAVERLRLLAPEAKTFLLDKGHAITDISLFLLPKQA